MKVKLFAHFIVSAMFLVMFVHVNSATADTNPPGDVDINGVVEISDVIYLISYIFSGGPEPPAFQNADVTNDCIVDISDAVEVVGYIFVPGHDPLDYGCVHEEFSSGCLGGPLGVAGVKGDQSSQALSSGCLEGPEQGADSGWLALEFIGNDLHIHHFNAYYQCCLEYMVEFVWDDNRHVTAFEYDTAETPCPCMCYFNLESIIYGLDVMEQTNYVVTLIGIEGDTVGVDSITIGGEEYMLAEVLGNDLHIHHINAFYQCCLGYYVDYQISGNNITATESDTGMLCDCVCYFNLESVFYNLANGEYIVTLIHENGDTVGVDTVIVDSSYGLIDYGDSGCLDMSYMGDSPGISYTYSDGILYFLHSDAWFNCAALIIVGFQQAGDTLRFYEFNISEEFTYCMCYFEINASVAGIPPGEYVAEVYDDQYPWTPITLVDRRTIQLGDFGGDQSSSQSIK